MKKEELYEILGDIDEKYLVEEKQPYSKKKMFLKLGSLAACFAVLVVTTLAIFPNCFNDKKGVILEDVAKPAVDEFNQQEHSAENYISMNQIHINHLSEVTNSTESDRFYYEPTLYDELKWGKKEILEYYGEDLTPAYIPEGLIASARNNTELTAFRKKDGDIAMDMLWLDFYNDYYEDGSPKLTENIAAPKGITVKASKVGTFDDDCYTFMPENEMETSNIEGTEVVFGYRSMEYGPYNPDTHEPTGYYDMYMAKFKHDGIHYLITTKQLDENEIIKVVGSIIYGEEAIIGES